MPPAPGSDPWAVSVRLGSDNRSWATTYGADRRAALGPPRSPSSAARTYTLGMLPPPTPRRDTVASVQPARLPDQQDKEQCVAALARGLELGDIIWSLLNSREFIFIQ